MIYTLRQLQDLHKQHGQVVLPYRARLTPLAVDWIRSKKVPVGYSDNGAMKAQVAEKAGPVATVSSSASVPPPPPPPPPSAADFFWWCDGPCGAAKGAIMSQSRESSLAPLDVPADEKYLVDAIKRLAGEVKAGRAMGGVLVVASGAPAVVYANHCPSLRAILGSCRDSVRQGIELVSANVLVIEHPYQTLAQVKNMLHLFCRGPRVMTDQQRRVMQELSSCA